MRTIVLAVSAVLLVMSVPAAAQDKMKTGAAPGHEGMAKAGGSKSDASIIAKATAAAAQASDERTFPLPRVASHHLYML